MKYLFLFLLLPKILFAQKDSLLYKMSSADFMKLPEVNKPIDARNPNNALIDAALFHLTNEQRVIHNLPKFKYSYSLHKATNEHSEAMINQDFYNHENPYSPANRKMTDRIFLYTWEFKEMAENIAQHDVLGGNDEKYCFEIPRSSQDYVYLSCETKKPLPMRTYAELAHSVVNGWMNSPHHRENILNPRLKSLACSGRISKNPFKTKRSPFARLTQDFGG
jgi:uncharacterized protein YkwD